MRNFFRTFWGRTVLAVAAGEAIVFGLAWVLTRYVAVYQRFFFSDLLLVEGTMALFTSAFGMMRHNDPQDVESSKGLPIPHGFETGEQRRARLVNDWAQQRAFGVRTAIVGAIAIVAAFILGQFSM